MNVDRISNIRGWCAAMLAGASHATTSDLVIEDITVAQGGTVRSTSAPTGRVAAPFMMKADLRDHDVYELMGGITGLPPPSIEFVVAKPAASK